jgi:hypothetical protein
MRRRPALQKLRGTKFGSRISHEVLPAARLPTFGEANYLARFPQFPQRLADSFFLAPQNEVGPDIGQRLKNKLSQVHTRVWQLQPLIFNVAIAAIEQVDVNRS